MAEDQVRGLGAQGGRGEKEECGKQAAVHDNMILRRGR
jgi:hypothetical protein